MALPTGRPTPCISVDSYVDEKTLLFGRLQSVVCSSQKWIKDIHGYIRFEYQSVASGFIFFSYSPLPGEIIKNWQAYVSDGLVQPPTSILVFVYAYMYNSSHPIHPTSHPGAWVAACHDVVVCGTCRFRVSTLLATRQPGWGDGAVGNAEKKPFRHNMGHKKTCLKLTAKAPENKIPGKGGQLLEAIIFRGYVSFGECKKSMSSQK